MFGAWFAVLAYGFAITTFATWIAAPSIGLEVIMGFASGLVTFRRYFMTGKHPRALDEQWLERVASCAFGKYGAAESDGVETGWIVPTHLFDVDFGAAERISAGPFIYLAMRMDRTTAPSAIVQSYRKIEEAAALEASGREHLSKLDRRAAREAAQDRADKEARAGAFRRVSAHPVVIDLREGVVYFGNLGATASDKMVALFADTFETTLAPATAEEMAYRIAQRNDAERAFDDAAPEFLVSAPDVATESGAAGIAAFPGTDRLFFGREFLAWLWFVVDTREGVVELDLGESLTLAIDRLMHLECGFGVTGKNSIRTDAPARSPESKAALRIGKLPTKMGLLLGGLEGEWSLTLDGPSLNVSSLALPRTKEPDPSAALEERFGHMRNAAQTLDRLYAAFIRRRLSAEWGDVCAAMRRWAALDARATQAGVQLATA